MEKPSNSGLDLADVLPVLASLSGGDIGKVIAIYVKNKHGLDEVFRLIKKLFGGLKEQATPAPVPAPTPTPTAVPPLSPLPPPPPQPPVRIITSLKLKLHLIEFQGQILPRERFLEVRDQGDNVDDGSRVHYDITPHDENGYAFRPGDQDHPDPASDAGIQYLVGWDGRAQLVPIKDYFAGKPDVGPLDVPLSLHSWHDDYGLTPVVKLVRGEAGGNHILEFQAILPPSAHTNGRRVVSNVVRVNVA